MVNFLGASHIGVALKSPLMISDRWFDNIGRPV